MLCRSVRLVEGEPSQEEEGESGESGESGGLAAPGVEWTGSSRWMEVSIGLVGEAGAMLPLGPTLRLPSQVPRASPCPLPCCKCLTPNAFCILVGAIQHSPRKPQLSEDPSWHIFYSKPLSFAAW